MVETLGLFPAGKGITVAKVLMDLNIPVCVGGFLEKKTRKTLSICLLLLN